MDRLREAAAPRYRILELLGYGGMAGVYLGEEPRLARKVAIKVMAPSLMVDPRMVERFQQEARSTARLSHPHIVTIHEIDERDGLHYFVMSYVEGPSLDEILKDADRPLPVSTVRRWLFQIAGALNHAHRSGIVHRDVKPGNVLVDPDGNAVVTDFGIAKVADEPGLTRTGMVVGTPSYMSPEQCMGGEVASAADQYALGALAYQLLTGRPPFTGPSMAVLQAHLSELPRPILELRPDCPPPMAELVHRMLAKNPAERWPSMTDVVGALEEAGETAVTNYEALAAPGAASSMAAPAARTPGRFRRRTMLVGLGAPMVILLGVFLLLRAPGTDDGVGSAEGEGALSPDRDEGASVATTGTDSPPEMSGAPPIASAETGDAPAERPETHADPSPPRSPPTGAEPGMPSPPAPAGTPTAVPVRSPATVEVEGSFPAGARLVAVGNAGTVPLATGGPVEVPPGRYVFEATAEGFQGDRLEVDLAEGQRFRWTPALAPAPGVAQAPAAFDASVARREIEASLTSLAAAFRSRDMGRVLAHYPDAPDEWRERWEVVVQNTEQIRELQVTALEMEHRQTGPEGAEVRFVLALDFVDFRNRANTQRHSFIASFLPGAEGSWILSDLRSAP